MEDKGLVDVQENEDRIRCVCEPQEYNLRNARTQTGKLLHPDMGASGGWSVQDLYV